MFVQFLMLALSSFGLGALHALEPGHGKTVVGAYLIGSKGRVWDAVVLGIVVTLTHSGSVLILGILSTVAAAYFVPDTVQKVLEVVSGLLVAGVGGWMIGVRLRQARGHQRGHEHGHSHSHVAPPAVVQPASHDGQEHSNGHPQEAAHDLVHAGTAHDHDTETHEHDPGDHHSHHHQEHPHRGDSHGHSHGGHSHSHVPVLKPGERPTLWQLITLGVSGGIVPCPAALAVLLAAVSFGQFVRGLSLVMIFSIGMAAVLVAIGIVMVEAASFASRYVAESRWTRIAPVVSASLITLVGLGLTTRAIMHILLGR
jgi:nickel/cobalt exporter